MWGKSNPPFMQMIHFAFGFGAFFAPFFAEPFLLQKPAEEGLLEIPDSIVHHTANLTTTPVSLMNSIDLNQTEVSDYTFRREDVHIQYSFYIVAAFASAILALCSATYAFRPSNKMHPSREINMPDAIAAAAEIRKALPAEKLKQRMGSRQSSMLRREHAASLVSTCSRPEMGALSVLAQDLNPTTAAQTTPTGLKVSMIFLAAFFMHCVYGVELSFGGLLATFAVKCDLHLSKTTASYMTSLYWAAFTFFRLFSIALVSCLSSRSMMHVSLCLIAVGNIILLPFGNQYEWALWLGSGLMGIGVSSVYPTLWGYLEDVIPVTGKITSLITIASCLGKLTLVFKHVSTSLTLFFLFFQR